jgi:hypothetical protein
MMSMCNLVLRRATAAVAAMTVVLSLPISASAQSTDQKATEQKPADGSKEAVPKRIDDFAEVARQLSGPAANPECFWLGRRVVSLLWRDDLDTAFRHLDLYDRFGCPGGHIQATFRCVVRQGDVDPKAADTLNSRIQACWIDPAKPTVTAQPATTAEQPGGTTKR